MKCTGAINTERSDAAEPKVSFRRFMNEPEHHKLPVPLELYSASECFPIKHLEPFGALIVGGVCPKGTVTSWREPSDPAPGWMVEPLECIALRVKQTQVRFVLHRYGNSSVR